MTVSAAGLSLGKSGGSLRAQSAAPADWMSIWRRLIATAGSAGTPRMAFEITYAAECCFNI